MKTIAAFLLALFVGAAFAQQPTPKECKEDPRRAGCQK
jgi:hypothetical protein